MKQTLSNIFAKYNIDNDTIEKIAKDDDFLVFKTQDEVNSIIQSQMLDFKLDHQIALENPKNAKLCKSLIDFEQISYVDGEIAGFQEQISKIKQENAFLFEEVNYSPSGGINTKNLDTMSDNDYFNFLKQTNGGF